MNVLRKYVVRIFGGLVALVHTCWLILAARPIKALADQPTDESTLLKRGWENATNNSLESLGVVGFLGGTSVAIVALLISFGDLVEMGAVSGSFDRWGTTGIGLVDDFLLALVWEFWIVVYGVVCLFLFALLLRLLYSVKIARTLQFASYWSSSIFLTFLFLSGVLLALSAIPVGPFEFFSLQMGLGEILGLILIVIFLFYVVLFQPPLYWSRTLRTRFLPIAGLHVLSLLILFGLAIAVDVMFSLKTLEPLAINETIVAEPDEPTQKPEVAKESEDDNFNIVFFPDLVTTSLQSATGCSKEECWAAYIAAGEDYDVALEELLKRAEAQVEEDD